LQQGRVGHGVEDHAEDEESGCGRGQIHVAGGMTGVHASNSVRWGWGFVIFARFRWDWFTLGACKQFEGLKGDDQSFGGGDGAFDGCSAGSFDADKDLRSISNSG